jgi:hypothetical protein
MSEWPKRFGVDHRGYTRFGDDGPYISYEDFERLLNFTAEFIKEDKRFKGFTIEEIKRSLLTQVPHKGEKNG